MSMKGIDKDKKSRKIDPQTLQKLRDYVKIKDEENESDDEKNDEKSDEVELEDI